MEYKATVEKDELNNIQHQEVAFPAEEATDAQEHILAKEAEEELTPLEPSTHIFGERTRE